MENGKEEKKDRKKLLILIILIIIIIAFFFLLKTSLFSNFTSEKAEEPLVVTKPPSETEEESALTPEEVLESLETDDSLGDNVSLAIVSPEGDTFTPAQARLWRAEFSDIETEDSFLAECKWSFYLNENNEEVLYKEQETRSTVSKASPQVCGFTSTLIESRGELRAEVNATVKDTTGKEIGTYQAERNYTVQ